MTTAPAAPPAPRPLPQTVSPADVEQVRASFQHQLAQLDELPLNSNITPEMETGRCRTAAEWNTRLTDTRFAADLMDALDPQAGATLARFRDGQSIGLLTLAPPGKGLSQKDRFANIEIVVTHPQTTGQAKLLVADAVNLAASAPFDCGGKLALTSMGPEADEAYRALGFSEESPGEWRLDPARSDRWQNVAGAWQLQQS